MTILSLQQNVGVKIKMLRSKNKNTCFKIVLVPPYYYRLLITKSEK